MKRKVNDHKANMRWLKKHAGKNSLGISVIAFLRILSAICGISTALLIKNVIDAAVDGSRESFFFWLLACAGVFLLQNGIYAFLYYLEEVIGFRLEKGIREQLYHCILHADYSRLEKKHTGELLNRLNGDVEIAAANMLTIFPGILGMAVRMVGSAVILAVWDWRFCGALLAGCLLIIPVTLPVRKRLKRLHKEVRESYDKVQSFQQETMGNMIMVRSFFSEKAAEKRLDERMKDLKGARLRRNKFSNFSYTGFACVMDLGYLMGLLWCGIGILEGSMTLGTLSAVLQLVGKVQEPIGDFTSYLSEYYALCASVERLRELEELPMEEAATELPGGRKYYENMTSVDIRNVSFSYERTPVLKNASLTIKKGDFVAFTGPSGIGKSTLLKLMLALYQPEEGRIVLCDERGEELLVSSGTRSLFAYVPQGNYLMSGTIYETVSFLQETGELTPEKKKEIRRACELACADGFIQELPQKYESLIGERGIGLSEGQAQRLAIARAIYSGAPILLLDEATSALDEGTEEQVLRNLKDMSEKTVLIVTHRKKALSVCSRIVGISDMQLKEERNHAGLQ